MDRLKKKSYICVDSVDDMVVAVHELTYDGQSKLCWLNALREK